MSSFETKESGEYLINTIMPVNAGYYNFYADKKAKKNRLPHEERIERFFYLS
jgi:hypothetical protein